MPNSQHEFSFFENEPQQSVNPSVDTDSPKPNLRLVDSENSNTEEKTKDGPRGAGVDLATLRDYLEDWIADGEYQGQSKNTLKAKREALGRLFWFMETRKLRRLGRFELRRFLTHIKNGHLEELGRWDANTPASRKPASDRTVQYYFVYVRTYLKWLFDEEVISVNPLAGLKPPKAPQAHISPFSIEEVAALLNAIPRILNRERNAAIIYFLLDTGVRVSELCDLRVKDVDIARRTATVTGKGNKTRDVWFGADTARILKKYLGKHKRTHEQLFFYSERPGEGEGMTRSGVLRMLTRLGDFAGLAEKRVSPHTFRHTFATEFIRSGGSPKALQLLLGHTDMKMTYKYVTLAEADAESQHRRHSPARLLRGTRKK